MPRSKQRVFVFGPSSDSVGFWLRLSRAHAVSFCPQRSRLRPGPTSSAHRPAHGYSVTQPQRPRPARATRRPGTRIPARICGRSVQTPGAPRNRPDSQAKECSRFSGPSVSGASARGYVAFCLAMRKDCGHAPPTLLKLYMFVQTVITNAAQDA